MNELLLPGKPRGGQTGRKRIIRHILAGIAGVIDVQIIFKR